MEEEAKIDVNCATNSEDTGIIQHSRTDNSSKMLYNYLLTVRAHTTKILVRMKKKGGNGDDDDPTHTLSLAAISQYTT